MKILLSAGVQTLMSMGDFVALLFLIICVFALMAQSFFGGTFMFDPDDGSLVAPEDCPRSKQPSCNHSRLLFFSTFHGSLCVQNHLPCIKHLWGQTFAT
eukprot:g21602.t1